MTERAPLRRQAIDLAAVALLLGAGIAGFWPTFAGPSYLVAAIGALVVGLGIAFLGARFRWGALLVTGAVVVAYFVLGGALALPQTSIAGVVPTLDTLQRLAVGVITSWKQLLTTVTPVAASDGHLIVVFLLTLAAAALAGSLALRLRRAAWALLPAAVYLALVIALGTSQPALPLVQGIAFAVVAVGWLAVREAWAPASAAVPLSVDGSASAARGGARRLIVGGAVVAVAAVIGGAASAVAVPSTPRYVLRDVVIPPFDVKDYPSPLQSYRALVRDDKDATLFTVAGLPKDARVRLAAMDAYTGTVYNVSDDGAGSSSAFSSLRGNMSEGAEGTDATMQVTMGDLGGVWLPTVGATTSVTFDGDRADDLRRAAHYNEATQTGVVTARLVKGDTYTLDAVVPDQVTDEMLAKATFAPLRMPKQAGVPQEFADIAGKATADAQTPIGQVRALQEWLSEDGFFSHGLGGEVVSRAGHGAQRIATLLEADQMVGDDEQYAVAMALLARELGIPARVVMGFHADADAPAQTVFTANGDDLHAWVEVAFTGFGWVPFDPTPPEDQVPTDQAPKPRVDPKPQVLQPPPPDQDAVDLPPTVPDEQAAEDGDKTTDSPIGLIIGLSAGGLGILAVLAAPFVVVGVVKATRRRRRRTADRTVDRISGGWDEVIDHASDLGAPVPPGATRREEVAVLEESFAATPVATLAHRADAGVF